VLHAASCCASMLRSVRRVQARDKALLLMERLQMVEPLVNRQPGANLRNVRPAHTSV
jgi:hypothetical protein